MAKPSWLTLDPVLGGTGSGIIDIKPSANRTVSAREYTFSAIQNDSLKKVTITVTQEAGVSVLSNTPLGSSPASYDGESDSCVITSTINGTFAPWTVTDKPSWLSTSISGNTVSITFSAQNPGASARDGFIEITQTESEVVLNIPVEQAAYPSVYVFSVGGQTTSYYTSSMPATGGSVTGVTVESTKDGTNIPWEFNFD